MSMQKHNR